MCAEKVYVENNMMHVDYCSCKNSLFSFQVIPFEEHVALVDGILVIPGTLPGVESSQET